MFNTVYVRELLTPTDLEEIRNSYGGLVWQDGSATSSSKHKINQQSIVSSEYPDYVKIDQIIANRILEDNDYYYMTVSTKFSPAIISKMEVGGKYGIHTDAPELGHYASTTFLSEPDEYEGGELCLKYDGEIHKYKLPAGSSITYLTGIPHCVAPVTKGTRMVAINWTTSMFSDITHRGIGGDIERIYDMLVENESFETFDESTKGLGYLITELRAKYRRHHA